MKTKAAKKRGPEHRLMNGRRVVILTQAEYERLRDKADEWEPLMPDPDEEGNYPALEALRVSLARKIVRHRRRVGLTQVQLARRAGIRPESLNRIEHARRTPSVPTIEKIEHALKRTEARDSL